MKKAISIVLSVFLACSIADAAGRSSISNSDGVSLREAEVELRSILAIFALSRVFAEADQLDQAGRLIIEIGERLAQFKTVFHRLAQQCHGYPAVRERSRFLIPHFDQFRGKCHYLPIEKQALCILLELAGFDEQWTAELAAVEPRKPHGKTEFTLQGLRLARFQRAGQDERALEVYEQVFSSWNKSVFAGSFDALGLSYGFLLLRHGHDRWARQPLQFLADLYPHWPGAQVAKAELRRRGWYIEPSFTRFHGYLRSHRWQAAVVAIGHHRFVGASSLLRYHYYSLASKRRHAFRSVLEGSKSFELFNCRGR